MNRPVVNEASLGTIFWSPIYKDEINHSSFDENKRTTVCSSIEFIDCGIKKEFDCSGESDDKISEKVNYEFIDCGIKKEFDCSGESDDKISEKVNYEFIDPDVREESECSATSNIKSERSTDNSFDIKYEDFEYDTHSHTLAEDHTIHQNNDLPHTSIESMFENISMEVCDMENLNTNRVTEEKRTISRESMITCNICHKSYTLKCTLNRHMRNVHKKEKRFSCDICHRSFSEKYILSQHVKQVHEGEKPLSCNVCHRSFSRKYYLSQHVKQIHEGEKPLSCNVCHSSFSRKILFISTC